jgi:hypothetical protein
MKVERRRILVVLAVLGVALGLARPAAAITACKAKISSAASSSGEIQVTAKGQGGAILWGIAAGKENTPCAAARKGNLCPLGASGTLAAETAPATCHLFLKDGGGSCAVRVKGCSPGVRIRDASFAADDPRVESVSLEDDGGTLRFTGVNLQVVSGSGTTYGAVNGRGNLIVGYNERKQCQFSAGPGSSAFTGSVCDTDADCNGGAAGYSCVTMDSSGSHNLVIGTSNGYSSYGGSAVGFGHSIEAPWCGTAGIDNRASGVGATVMGGTLNTASYTSAAVAGGQENLASAFGSAILGGAKNKATEVYATAVGGFGNGAAGQFALTAGGEANQATGSVSWTGGGFFNLASNGAASAMGGICNIAGPGTLLDPVFCAPSQTNGYGSLVAGGWRNQTTGGYATVSGGQQNVASGGSSSVSGGFGNLASGGFASVTGGICNVAGLGTLADPTDCVPGQSDGFGSAVSGGWRNQTTGGYSTVTGGQTNLASGGSSSVSGGNSVTQATGYGWSGGSTGAKVTGSFSSP